MDSNESATTKDAVAETIGVAVETNKAWFTSSKNQIHFIADNQTPFNLIPNSTTFADWGDFASGPVTVKPFTSNGDAGHVKSSNSPFTGSAGMVGYSINGPNGGKLYLRMLGSNPYISTRSNWAYVSILSSDEAIDQEHYNTLYSAETQSASSSFEGKTLSLKGSIGQADEATATFRLTYS